MASAGHHVEEAPATADAASAGDVDEAAMMVDDPGAWNPNRCTWGLHMQRRPPDARTGCAALRMVDSLRQLPEARALPAHLRAVQVSHPGRIDPERHRLVLLQLLVAAVATRCREVPAMPQLCYSPL